MRLWFAITLLLTLLLSAAGYFKIPGSREAGLFEGTPPTPYFRYAPLGEVRGRVLMVHGLDSNRNVGNFLSYSLAEAGFEVVSIDLPGHGDSAAGFDALVSRRVLAEVLDSLGPDTAVVGHSMGGALLLDVASDHPLSSMVLFSPAPTPIETVLADRILLIEGEFDPGRIRAFVPKLTAAATGSVEFDDLPWAGHSSGLFRPQVIRKVAAWLGGHTQGVRIERRIGLWVLMLISSLGFGIALIGTSRPAVPQGSPANAAWPQVILTYVGAAILAAGVLAVVGITDWLRLFAMNYLVGFLFLAGGILSLRLPRPHFHRRAMFVAAGAVGYFIFVPGLIVGSEVVHLTLSAGRLWRFAAMAALGFPLFLADEHVVRPIQPWLKAAGVAVITRILLGAIAVTGVLIIHRRDAFFLLIAHLIVIFWIALWFAGDVVRRRTQDAVSAALFASLIQAWVFASVFALT